MREVGEVLFELNSQDESGVPATEMVKSFSAVFLAVGTHK